MIVDNINNIMFYHSMVRHLAAGMAAVEALGRSGLFGVWLIKDFLIWVKKLTSTASLVIMLMLLAKT